MQRAPIQINAFSIGTYVLFGSSLTSAAGSKYNNKPGGVVAPIDGTATRPLLMVLVLELVLVVEDVLLLVVVDVLVLVVVVGGLVVSSKLTGVCAPKPTSTDTVPLEIAACAAAANSGDFNVMVTTTLPHTATAEMISSWVTAELATRLSTVFAAIVSRSRTQSA